MALLHRQIQKLLTPFVKVWLEQHLNYLLSYESRVRELDRRVKNLRKERDRVQRKVDEEENRYGREIDVDVKNWLQGIDNIISEYETFKKDNIKDHAYALCSDGFLPKPGIRYRLCKTATNILGKVNGLLQTAKHDNFSYWRGPPSMGVSLSNIDYESFASRDETMKNIMAALEDSSVRMIGVHGLRGVGKTTLVIEAAKEALETEKWFDVVIMVNATRNPDVRRLQGQIADMLGIKLEEESEMGRAARIRERLKNEKENTLIILDDLWAKLDLNVLGIPSDNDDDGQKNLKEEKLPGAYEMMKTENYLVNTKDFSASTNMKIEEPLTRCRGCKVLLISEAKQVLLNQMYGKGNSIFYVEVLKDQEAETLFKSTVEIGDENYEFENLAAQIASKCKGLPLAIITTARALKNKSRPVWEDVHRQLERPMFTGVPEFSTKLSYDLLEDEELKYTFLLCARMGKDALIVDLVRYCFGAGFLEGIYTVREARDKVHALVGKLKESSLLSDSYSSDRFTMQDIVRHAALSIASKQLHVFTMTKGKLDEWPDKDQLERCTAISLQHCDIIVKFPKSINCPRLRVFHVDSNDPHLQIPDNFFNGMRELRVLILTGINLSPFPRSIGCLTKLRMLCLERCKLGELSIIRKLKNLRILSLSGSDIKRLPDELQHLAMLQIFDISDCSELEVIQPNVLSKLTALEELYIRNNLIQWRVDGQIKESQNASLLELGHLDHLTTLDILIPDVAHLPDNLFFDKLDSYKIFIGGFNTYPVQDSNMLEAHEASRLLALEVKDGFNIHNLKGIKLLFERVENLLLGELTGVQDVFDELNWKGFPYLKDLSIVSNSDIRCIIHSTNKKHPKKAFPKLESLCLCKLKYMEQVCYGELTNDSFRKLKIIKIKLCGQLKDVFSFSMVGLLTSLETIEVSECDSLENIVLVETPDTPDTTTEIEFPELRSLTLQSLSRFIGFYNRQRGEIFDKKVVAPKLERLELSSIKIRNIWSGQLLSSSYVQFLIHLYVNDCGSLKYLLTFSMAKSFVNLQSLFVNECEMMECIIKEEDTTVEIEGGIFPKLKSIKLSSMKRLRKMWHTQIPLDSFVKLDTLIIQECHKLDNVFPPYMVGRFRSLCNLRVNNCKSLKEIFDLQGDLKRDTEDVTNLQNVHLQALPKLKHVWNKDTKGILNFKNLEKIWVQGCPNLKNIFTVSVAKGLEKLEYLVVWDCDRLNEIVAKEEGISMSNIHAFDFPKLTTVKLLELPELESFYPGGHILSWSALNNLSVELCDKMEPFRTVTTADPEIDAVFFPDEVISSLKSIQIELHHAEWLKRNIENYQMHKLEGLQLSRLVNTKILYFFLHRSPSLKSLCLNNCFVKELVPRGHANERLGVVPYLKTLKLVFLPLLKEIGFERDKILQRIEYLILEDCHNLSTIAPSSVSFTYLTNLEVVNCNGLTNLMSPSTAKSLVQLTTMKVIQCALMTEIVSEQGNETIISVNIVFRQLKALELRYLQNLTSFCSSQGCEFDFPSLEKLVVTACPHMESFSKQIKSTPILRRIYVERGKEEKRWYWEGDLNATIQKMSKDEVFHEDIDKMIRSDLPNPQELWKLAKDRFHSLTTLKLENCNFQSHALIEYNILPYLKNLNELQVQNCSDVKVIFDRNETETKGTAFRMKKLTLDGLPNLKRVWDENSGGILSFQNLHEVLVTNCENLKTLFPLELAKRLKKLEKLVISECKELLQIIGEEEAAAEGTQEFFFSNLTLLDLSMLPQLTCFYPGKFTLECPELTHLDVQFCDKLEVFQNQQRARHVGEGSASANGQPLFSAQQVIFNLESLRLNWTDAKMLHNLTLCFYDGNELEGFQSQQEEDSNSHGYASDDNQPLSSTRNLHNIKYELSSLEAFQSQREGDSNSDGFSLNDNRPLSSTQKLEAFQSQREEDSDSHSFALDDNQPICSTQKLEAFQSQREEDSNSHGSTSYNNRPLSFSQKLEPFQSQREKDFDIHGFASDDNQPICSTLKFESFQSQPKEDSDSHGSALDDNQPRSSTQKLEAFRSQREEDSNSHGFTSDDNQPLSLSQKVESFQSQLEEDSDSHGSASNDNHPISSTQKLEAFQSQREEDSNSHGSASDDNRPLSLSQKVEPFQSQLEEDSDSHGSASDDNHRISSTQKLEAFQSQREGDSYSDGSSSNDNQPLSSTQKLEAFQSLHKEDSDSHGSASDDNRLLSSTQKVIFNMASSGLNWTETMTCNANFPQPQDKLDRLIELKLCFYDRNEVYTLPFGFLEKAPNLEHLVVSRCRGLEVIFPFRKLQLIGVGELLGRLKTLSLFELPALESICFEPRDSWPEWSSWSNGSCELRKLFVSKCPCLNRIEVDTGVFSNLKELFVEDCEGLEYLFTTSTAAKLGHLEKMYIVRCKSIQEILAEGQDHEKTSDRDIKFERLNTVVLDSLPSLVCFHSGEQALQLPSLITVFIWQCPKMKSFSGGVINAESFLGIQVSWDPTDDLAFNGDLKATVEKLFLYQDQCETRRTQQEDK